MSTVLLDTTVASLLHPKKSDDALRAKYEGDMKAKHATLSSKRRRAVVVG